MAFGLGAGIGPIVAGPLVHVDFAAPFVVGGLLVALGAGVVHTNVTDAGP